MSTTPSQLTTPDTTPRRDADRRRNPAAADRRKARAVGVGLTAVVTSLAWLVGSAAGADYRITDPTSSAVIDLPTTFVITVIFGLLGWAALAALERLVRRRAHLVWTVLAALVVAASMVPIGLVEATTATAVALAAIHLVVGVALVPALIRPARRTAQPA